MTPLTPLSMPKLDSKIKIICTRLEIIILNEMYVSERI